MQRLPREKSRKPKKQLADQQFSADGALYVKFQEGDFALFCYLDTFLATFLAHVAVHFRHG